MPGLHLQILIGVAAALWAIVLLMQGQHVSMNLLAPFSTVVSAISAALVLFDRWGWKLPAIHPWLVPFPDLNGTWQGSLQSNWVDPQTHQRVGTIAVFLVVRQTYSKLSVRVLTEESESELTIGSFLRADDGTADLVCVYRNTPKQSVRHRSPIHHGAIVLRVAGIQRLEGSYWTDRDTRGELRFTQRAKEQAKSFADARTLPWI